MVYISLFKTQYPIYFYLLVKFTQTFFFFNLRSIQSINQYSLNFETPIFGTDSKKIYTSYVVCMVSILTLTFDPFTHILVVSLTSFI